MTAAHIAARLPNIKTLQQRCQAVAMLDAILSPDVWDNRWYSYTHDWGDGESCAQMRNGCGDDCYIVFTTAGAFIRGFDHESPMTPWRTEPPQLWPGLIDDVPDTFRAFLSEPAFAYDDVFAATYVLWHQNAESVWQTGQVSFNEMDERDDPQGAHQFLDILTDATPRSYIEFAQRYFEVSVDPIAAAHIYDHRPLTERIVRTINPEASLADVATDILDANYPT